MYTSYKFGPPDRQVKLILLDVRYFADRRADIDGDTLDEQQWAWLELQLQDKAQLTVIASGT